MLHVYPDTPYVHCTIKYLNIIFQGLSGVDFVLYVSAVPSEQCSQGVAGQVHSFLKKNISSLKVTADFTQQNICKIRR